MDLARKIRRLKLGTCSTMVYECFDTSAADLKEGVFSRAKSAVIGFQCDIIPMI